VRRGSNAWFIALVLHQTPICVFVVVGFVTLHQSSICVFCCCCCCASVVELVIICILGRLKCRIICCTSGASGIWLIYRMGRERGCAPQHEHHHPRHEKTMFLSAWSIINMFNMTVSSSTCGCTSSNWGRNLTRTLSFLCRKWCVGAGVPRWRCASYMCIYMGLSPRVRRETTHSYMSMLIGSKTCSQTQSRRHYFLFVPSRPVASVQVFLFTATSYVPLGKDEKTGGSLVAQEHVTCKSL
jgi:hypothetical protein